MNQREEWDDSELLRSMLTGDEDALVVLYRRRQAAIYRFAYQMSGCVSLAEDVTQEVFLFLMRDGQLFDPRRGSLSSFLLGVARNYVLRRLRSDHLLSPLSEDVASDEQVKEASPLDDLTRAESIESVRKAVLSLPERYREVVVLCELQEMSYAEAADVLECAIGTVRSRLHRARALLLNKLQPVRAEPTAAEVKSERCFA
ncbi:MAG TPA: RNA polymerase sigma factor [Pyrinomonadaceae bacterium]|nr:RNA polymerase sigma factor [Pyrinomonadaceae bacterium]